MDGNRRWARKRNLSTLEGYQAGVSALRRVVSAAAARSVRTLTVFGFSTENWKRERAEVHDLMRLCAQAARMELWPLVREGIKVRLLGDTASLPQFTQHALEALVWNTARNRGLTLQLALNYSGRAEIVHAARALARDVAASQLMPDAIDERALRARFFLPGMPDPDLLVRTGGDFRVSNFLLYQLAYTEFFTTPVLWPDFGAAELDAILDGFTLRRRRFGT